MYITGYIIRVACTELSAIFMLYKYIPVASACMNITVTILYCMLPFFMTRSYMGICMSAVRALGSMPSW